MVHLTWRGAWRGVCVCVRAFPVDTLPVRYAIHVQCVSYREFPQQRVCGFHDGLHPKALPLQPHLGESAAQGTQSTPRCIGNTHYLEGGGGVSLARSLARSRGRTAPSPWSLRWRPSVTTSRRTTPARQVNRMCSPANHSIRQQSPYKTYVDCGLLSGVGASIPD
jgi:hypothetical protein